MPNTYTKGNLVRVRFAFPNRTLTVAETATYVAGGNLPVGVGFDPDVIKFDHTPTGSATLTYTYPATIVRESAGQYHVDIDTNVGVGIGGWTYKGYSTGNGQAAIQDEFFIE